MSVARNDEQSIRAFFALEVKGAEVIRNIEKLQDKLSEIAKPLRIKMVEPENIHLTVRFLGNISPKTAESLYEFTETRINSVFFKDGPLSFDVVGLKDFKGKTFFCDLSGPVNLLSDIWEILERELTQNHDFEPDRKFKAHVTIGRLKFSRDRRRRQPAKINMQEYSKLKSEYKETKLGTITFDRLYLKKSTLTPTGPIYENIHFE